MLYTICFGLILAACVLMILAVLVQSPKSGMAANFGASNQVMGVRQTTDFLEKFTWVMAAAILALSLLATVVINSSVSGGSSQMNNDAANIMQQVAAPAPESTPATEPAATTAEPAATPAE